MRSRSSRQVALGAVLGGIGTVVLLWELVESPLVFVLALTVVGAGITARLSTGGRRAAAFNVALFSALLLPVEGYFAYRDRTAAATAQPPALTLDDPLPEGITTALPSDPKWVLTENRGGLSVYQAGGRLMKLNHELGWIHRESARVGERMYRGEELLFDVTYDIGPNGLRVTPTNPGETAGEDADRSAPVVLFVGCSFTFGQGLSNAETLPAAFATASKGKLEAINWGISGAGPHTVLAHLEAERDRDLLVGRRTPYAVYLAIRHHLRRIEGDTHFSAYYPRYALRDGALVREGQFSEPKPRSQMSFGEALAYEARKSHLLAHLSDRLPSAIGWADDEAAALFVAIVGRTAQLLEQRHGTELIVILWDDFGPETDAIGAGLSSAGVRYFDAPTVFPNFAPETHFFPHYEHPNALANRELAEFLAERLEVPPPPPSPASPAPPTTP